MADEAITIYGLPRSDKPLGKIITLSEESNYLNCKFWHRSADEAERFYHYYDLRNHLGNFIGLLSGEYLKKGQSCEEAFKKIACAISKFQPTWGWNIKIDESLNVDHLKPILNELANGLANKEIALQDDANKLLDWAKNKKVFSKKTLKEAREQVANVRGKIFRNDPVTQANFHILKPILLNGFDIYLEDAKAIFFPEDDIADQLSNALKNNEFLRENYFPPKDLVRWLIKNNYLSQWLVNEFEEWKIETIKEASLKLSLSGMSFASLEKNNNNKEDIIQSAAKREIPLYLKYPYAIQWRVISKKDDATLPKMRYEGFGQLKAQQEDDTSQCQFGGYTLDMLVLSKKPFHCLQKNNFDQLYSIEFVPTAEEAKYGLQPYIEIPKSELVEAIADKNLVVIDVNTKGLKSPNYLKKSTSFNAVEKKNVAIKDRSEKVGGGVDPGEFLFKFHLFTGAFIAGLQGVGMGIGSELIKNLANNASQKSNADKTPFLNAQPNITKQVSDKKTSIKKDVLPNRKDNFSDKTSHEKPVFTKEDGHWIIQYQETKGTYQHLFGFIYIQYLLSKPNQHISCGELRSLNSISLPENMSKLVEDNAEMPISQSESYQKISDDSAISSYKKRLTILKEEIDEARKEAEETQDEKKWEEVERLESEQEEILKEMQRTRNRKGVSRNFTDKTNKDAKAVQKAIKTACEKLAKKQSDLAVYLQKNIKTGANCIYTSSILKP